MDILTLVIVGLCAIAYLMTGVAIFVAILPALVRDITFATGDIEQQRDFILHAGWSIMFLWAFYTAYALKLYARGARWPIAKSDREQNKR